MRNNTYENQNEYLNNIQETFLNLLKEAYKNSNLDMSCFDNKEFCDSVKSCISGLSIKVN